MSKVTIVPHTPAHPRVFSICGSYGDGPPRAYEDTVIAWRLVPVEDDPDSDFMVTPIGPDGAIEQTNQRRAVLILGPDGRYEDPGEGGFATLDAAIEAMNTQQAEYDARIQATA
jgi:hypothetical protein